MRRLELRIVGCWIVLGLVHAALADPCGMVPPIYEGPGVPLARVGEQQTYVFYRKGIESLVIRPGFRGKVEDFGMLIPFPTAPAIRKVPDHIFSQIAAAVDPPEVVIDCSPPMPMAGADGFCAGTGAFFGREEADESGLEIQRDEVRVLKEEAVGMYEVAVLEAGSPVALKKWMAENAYRFPEGMESVCNDYVNDRWCFVAVKTRISEKAGVDPRPGQRAVRAGLPEGASFDGYVQAMGFRFRSRELVVPMRLSAFNEGELRNVVYLLTLGPQRIQSIPEEFVRRQVGGKVLVDNLTKPLPLRLLHGGLGDLQDYQKQGLKERRDPTSKNGAARELFTADLESVVSDELSLDHEEREKVLLRVGERLGLRGAEIDRLNAKFLAEVRTEQIAENTPLLRAMTLTVVDGDFPREVISSENLTFVWHRILHARNTPYRYDARLKKARKPYKGKNVLIRDAVADVESRGKNRRVWRLLFGCVAFLGVVAVSRSTGAAVRRAV